MKKLTLSSVLIAFFLISCGSELPDRPTLTKGKIYQNKGDDDATPGKDEDPKTPGETVKDGEDKEGTDKEVVESDSPDKDDPSKAPDPEDPRAADLKILEKWTKGEVIGNGTLSLVKLNLLELK